MLWRGLGQWGIDGLSVGRSLVNFSRISLRDEAQEERSDNDISARTQTITSKQG